MELSFNFPVDFIKTGDEIDGRIPIKIIPSDSSVDRQGDKIVLKAFNKKCIDNFIKYGVIDYDHQSFLAKTPLEKAKAIIGEPEKMYIDKQKNTPVIEGFLFKSNPYVIESILPALNSKSRVFGASLGGKIIRKSTEKDPDTNNNVNIISEISLAHCAITPLQKAVNQNTSVMLRKSSCARDGSCGNKACAGKCEDKFELNFDSFDTFIKSFNDDSILSKALEAGIQTDSAKITGGQALQTQSLECDSKKKKKKNVDKNKIKKHMQEIVLDVIKGNIGPKYEDYDRYLKLKGFNDDEVEDTVRLLAMNGARIVKLVI